MPSELPGVFDPEGREPYPHANFNDYPPGPLGADTVAYAIAVGALISVGAFAVGASVAPFVAASELAAPEVYLGVSTIEFVAEGEVVSSFTVLVPATATDAQLALLAGMEAGAMSSEPVAVAAMLNAWGMEFFTVEGIAALAAFDATAPPTGQQQHAFNIQEYLRHFFDNGDPWTGEPPQGGGFAGQAPHPGRPPGRWNCYWTTYNQDGTPDGSAPTCFFEE